MNLVEAIAEHARRESEATARADALESGLARMGRHDARDHETGRFRPMTSAEAHAAGVGQALLKNRSKNAALAAMVTGQSLNPTAGMREDLFPTTPGDGARAKARQQEREHVRFMNSLIPAPRD